MALTRKQLIGLRGAAVSKTGNRVALAVRIARGDNSDVPTQASIAEAIGVSQQYFSDVACGRYQTITVDNASKFAEYFGCAIEDLFPAKEAIAS